MSEEATLDEFIREEDSDESPKGESEWVRRSISQISRWTDAGGTPRTSNEDYWEGDIPWVQTGELTKRHITETEKQITELGLEESTAKRFPPGTLLIGMYGEPTVGESALLEIEATTNQACCGIFPDADIVNAEFLHQMMQYEKPRLYSLRAGSGQQNIRQGIIRKFEIGVPSLPEQRKIATVLYTVDRAIEKIEEIIEQIERTKQALTQTLLLDGYFDHSETVDAHHQNCLSRHPVEWHTKPAGELIEVTRGAHPRPKSDDTLWRGDIPIVKIGDRDQGDSRTIFSTDDTVTDKGSQKSKLVDEGTLIVSNAGTVGTARITGMKTCIHDHWLILRDYDESLSTRYLYYFINWNQKFLEALASGSTVLDLSTDDFRLFDITFPSLDEQRKIADSLDALHDQKMVDTKYSN